MSSWTHEAREASEAKLYLLVWLGVGGMAEGRARAGKGVVRRRAGSEPGDERHLVARKLSFRLGNCVSFPGGL